MNLFERAEQIALNKLKWSKSMGFDIDEWLKQNKTPMTNYIICSKCENNDTDQMSFSVNDDEVTVTCKKCNSYIKTMDKELFQYYNLESDEFTSNHTS